MSLINFDKRFAEAVANGMKQQTIRKRRKRPIEAGDRLYFYTGLRTKEAKKIGEGVCSRVSNITIDWQSIRLGKCYLTQQQRDGVIWADGFTYLFQFVDWFQQHYGLPFEGVLIEWEPI